MPDWVLGALAWNGFALVLLGIGIASWTGRWPPGRNRRARWYHQVYANPEHPFRGKIMSAPATAYGLALVLAQVAFLGIGPVFWVALALFILGAFWQFRPPGWSKPAWLKEEERRARENLPPVHAVPPEGRHPTASRLEFVAAAALIGAAVVGVVLWSWPPSLLIGAGIGMSVLAVTRMRR